MAINSCIEILKLETLPPPTLNSLQKPHATLLKFWIQFIYFSKKNFDIFFLNGVEDLRESGWNSKRPQRIGKDDFNIIYGSEPFHVMRLARICPFYFVCSLFLTHFRSATNILRNGFILLYLYFISTCFGMFRPKKRILPKKTQVGIASPHSSSF